MANFIKHSVKITPLEKQVESPYDWYPHSSFNHSAFGATFHHSANLDRMTQQDDINVPEGGDQLLIDMGLATHQVQFILVHNTGNNPAVLKFTQVGVGNTTGYKWYVGVNEVWAASVAYNWTKMFGYAIGGHTKVSILSGQKDVVSP